MARARGIPVWLSGAVVAAAGLAPAVAEAAPITYSDIAQDPATGIGYRRIKSVTDAIFDGLKLRPFMSLEELNAAPEKSTGAPGVALLDYDKDGDLDIYATNGPGRANSLYQNQRAQTGQTKFVDVGSTAGVGAADQDSTGVCYGDIDNDGDDDLYVLGRMEQNRLFKNNGNGTFSDITTSSGAGAGVRGHTSCSIGDINNDGLVDIFVANSHDWQRKDGIYSQFFAFNHHNQLLRNLDGSHFADVSGSSGVEVLLNAPPGDATITWASAMVDFDQDGDIDIIHGDDQGALPTGGFAGIDRGLIQIFKNDGSGQFTNVTATAGTGRMPSPWMGFAFGDINSDGYLDMMGTSVGDYMVPQFGIPIPPGFYSSQWFLGTPDGGFFPPGLGALGTTPFGWGTQMFDYDNDGDTDIAFYGSLDATPFLTADNPGIVLANDGAGNFSWDQAATVVSAEFVSRQGVQGMATGDLNGDGYMDMVHVSSHYAPPALPLVQMSQLWGTVFDAAAYFVPTFTPIGPVEYEWSGKNVEEGFLGVQISSASTGNKWAKVTAIGAKGLTPGGKVNRSAIGAIVKFTPAGGKSVMSPVLGGSSYASQHELTQGFGLGAASSGTAEVLWPGKVKNRMYGVAAGETVKMPEIPCSYDAAWSSRMAYRRCVDTALGDLQQKNVIDSAARSRLRDSALRAYDETH